MKTKGLTVLFIPAALVLAVGFALVTDSSSGLAAPVCAARDDDGRQVQRCITLDPATASATVGGQHTVTATVTDDGIAIFGEEVRIEVKSGPNVGQFVESGLSPAGQLVLSYTDAGGAGADAIQACILDLVEPGPCADATMVWGQQPTQTQPPATGAGATTRPVTAPPRSGGSSDSGGSSLPLIAIGLGGLALLAGAGAVLYRRTRSN